MRSLFAADPQFAPPLREPELAAFRRRMLGWPQCPNTAATST